MNIRTSVEAKRGCGYRKAGGLYLMGGYPADSCHRLPFELHVCPTCSAGIKPARGWTWIDSVKLFAPGCESWESDHCGNCIVCVPANAIPQKEFEGDPPEHFGMSGLIWIGEKFYPTPESFVDEANALGVSRRIKSVPNGFVLGETWVFFAHRFAVEDEDNPAVDKRHPGIFKAFMPTSIDYVVKGDETEEELKRMEKRGISLVNVVRKDVNQDIEFEKQDLPLKDLLPSGIANKLAFEAGHNMISDIEDMSNSELEKIKGVGPRMSAFIRSAVYKYRKAPNELD